jgi:hypothetical protein
MAGTAVAFVSVEFLLGIMAMLAFGRGKVKG